MKIGKDELGIVVAGSRRDRPAEIENITKLLPTAIAAELRAQLVARPEGFHGMQCDPETRNGYWINADEVRLLVVIIPDLDPAKAPVIQANITGEDAGGDPDKILRILGAEKITRH